MRGDGVRVLIVGGGVAGLATVAALREWGATIDVVERASAPTDSGTGIYLTGNATRMLDVLGLRESVADVAVEISRQRSANQRGRRLFDIDVAALDYDDSTLHAGPNQEVVLDSWSRGPLLLIGDAAHATSPNMAQGAAMALEDAVVLASSLTAAGSIAEALRGYQERRRPRTDWVLSQTHRRDKATGLPPALRDLVMRRLGEQMFRSNYGPLFAQP